MIYSRAEIPRFNNAWKCLQTLPSSPPERDSSICLRLLSLLPRFVHVLFSQESDGIRRYVSMAALNAAKPAQPSAAAWGPAFAASAPPVMQPALTLFVMSFLARNCALAVSIIPNTRKVSETQRHVHLLYSTLFRHRWRPSRSSWPSCRSASPSLSRPASAAAAS